MYGTQTVRENDGERYCDTMQPARACPPGLLGERCLLQWHRIKEGQ